jgi:hypothetical protein
MRGLVMTTRIAGDQVAKFNTLTVEMELAWGGEQETYSFQVESNEIISSK